MVESVSNKSFSLVILIPVYNHEEAIGPTLNAVLEHGYPVLLVDDGSSLNCQLVLKELAETFSSSVSLLRLDRNGGKGAAVKAGFRDLKGKGYTHAIQIDADGQHDLNDLAGFVEAGRNNPESLVTGYPKYDKSVPKLRYYSRYLTHVWVWVNTLSFKIKDTMCGFRVYPLTGIVNLVDQENCGDRMDFDPEIIVRWYWRGGEVINLPTQVRYPLDGISHFDLWRDNYLISVMHTRLFFGMLKRLPRILKRKLNG